MRNLKRVLSLALATVMLLGMMIVGTSAADISDFTDAGSIAESHKEAVAVMAGLKIMEGVGDGSFNPDGTLTRAQMAGLVGKMMHGSAVSASQFADLDLFDDYTEGGTGSWARGWINLAASDNIVKGTGDRKFNPSRPMTVGETVVLFLNALGIETTGANWNMQLLNAMAKANEIGLLGDLNADLGATTTREMAAVMMFEALQYSPSGARSYAVTVDGNTYSFDNATDAYFYYESKKADGATLNISTAKDSIGSIRFGLTIKTDAEDEFGRTATKYTSTLPQYKDLDVLIATTAATYTYTSKTAENKLGLAKGTTYEASLKATVDGKPNDSSVIDGADDLADLTADNAVVEVYTSGNKITKIIKINTYADTVATVVKATDDEDRKITLTNASGLTTIYNETLEKDDVVLYTKAWNETNYDVVSIKTADSFTGTMTRFTSDGKYTISSSVYTLPADDAGVYGGLNATAMQGYIGEEMVYFLNDAGQVIYAKNTDGTTATGNYAYILKSNVTVSGDWLTSGTITAEVQAVLSDGTVGVYELAVKKTAGESGSANANKTKYTVAIGNTDQPIAEVSSSNWIDNTTTTSALQTAMNDGDHGIGSVVNGNVYDYSINDGKITLRPVAAYAGTEAANAVANMTLKTGATITASTLVATASYGVSSEENVILNNNTVYVLIDGTKTTVVTGAASLAATSIAKADVKAIVAKITATGESTKVPVANVVFATKKFQADSNVDANDYIYLTGTYATVKDGNKTVYAYEAYKADGSKIEVTANVDTKTAGLYTYDSAKMTLAAEATYDTKIVKEANVTYVTGETVIVGSTGITVNSDTNVVLVDEEGKLEAGARIAYVTDNKGVASVVFVLGDCAHRISAVAQKTDATCQEFNYDAHWKCIDCGQLFSDATGETEIDEAPNKAAGTVHNMSYEYDSTTPGTHNGDCDDCHDNAVSNEACDPVANSGDVCLKCGNTK